MTETASSVSRNWVSEQVAAYSKLLPDYRSYATVLQKILRRNADRLAPQSVVQTRAKSIASFAEKIIRKRNEHRDPVHQLTDLCGVRVITRTRSDVESVARFLESHLEIDRENSVDTSQRLKPTEFGYRSVHFVVSLRRDVDYGVTVPDGCYGLKAEIQLRTFAEHAWADFAHDLSYKGAFKLPDRWIRELAGLAAMLEEIQGGFGRIEDRLRSYATTYGSYLEVPEARAEIERLEIVLEHDPENAGLAARIGKLAISIEDWEKAVEVLSRFVKSKDLGSAYPPVLRDLGIALCKHHKGAPRGEGYRQGQRYLEFASAPRQDVDAVASYAGTWKKIDDAKARDLYLEAVAIDPGDPYPLGNFLEFELERDPTRLELVRPLIRGAVERCQAHIEVGINLPWALYDLGKFRLLLGQPYESLDAYAKAVQSSTAAFMIETSLTSLDRLSALADLLPGYEWLRRLLLVGLAARFPAPEVTEQVRELASAGGGPIQPPVAIVAGGTDPRVEAEMRGYERLILDGFSDFEGTIISGGTRQGVSGLVGDLAALHPGRIRALGYLPATVPPDATVDQDRRRYSELRYTRGEGFTPHEPLQNWIDLIASGVSPRDVRVVGINGGRIAAAEYRIALAAGATVGILAESGREAGRILTDERWAASDSLIRLPRDPQTLAAFVAPARSELAAELLDKIARAVHEGYRAAREGSLPAADRAMADWENLPEDLKDSNRAQARDIAAKLRRLGCLVEEPGRAEAVTFSEQETEKLAEMEHGRWNVEKLLGGWSWGEERDPERKTSPFLVGWSELRDDVKELDRRAAREIPRLLREVGLSIRRRQGRREDRR